MARAETGIDIVEIERMARVLERTPRFRERVFSEAERAYCERMAHPAAHYACRFAAREAVLKALGTGFSQGVGLADVSVSHDANGRPRAELSGRAAEIAEGLGVVEVAISLSFTGSLAVANAVALTEDARPKASDEVDPKAELARSFREARSLIDELERIQLDEFDEGDGADEGDAPEADEPAPAHDAPAPDESELAPTTPATPVQPSEDTTTTIEPGQPVSAGSEREE